MSKQNSSYIETVKAAGTATETLWVLLAGVIIVLLSSALIIVRSDSVQSHSLESFQLNSNDDLLPSEQGIYTDLVSAVDEIQLIATEDGYPDVTELSVALIPPFVTDISTQSRGAHIWSLLQQDGVTAYLGRSQDLKLSRSFLLIFTPEQQHQQHNHHHHGDNTNLQHNTVQIWLEVEPNRLGILSSKQLIESGWKEVISHSGFGMTRNKE